MDLRNVHGDMAVRFGIWEGGVGGKTSNNNDIVFTVLSHIFHRDVACRMTQQMLMSFMNRT